MEPLPGDHCGPALQEGLEMNSLLLIDIGSVFWPCWFATKNQIEAYAHAVDLIERSVRDHWRSVVCCDSPTNWRHKLTAELPTEAQYKANREKKPAEAIEALRDVQARVEEWGLPVVLCEGYEADDVIATLVDQAMVYEVRILSEDKDLYQLIDQHCHILTRNGVRDVAGCRKKFSVLPSQMRDLLAMVGDTADNIAGCPGVGPGKAAALLNHFGSLEKVLAAPDAELRAVKGIGEKIVTALREWDPGLALELVSLARDVPVDLTTLLELEQEAADEGMIF